MSVINSLTTSSPTPQVAPAQGINRERALGLNNGGDGRFTKEELDLIAELKRRDREVRAHEQAHLAAAGPYAKGGARFTYQRGPDGKNYAIGGEVSIDTSPVRGDPEATLRKAEQVRRAANAPAQPSAQDRAVAADAAAMAIQARIDIARERQEEQREEDDVEANQGLDSLSGNSVNNDLLSNGYRDDNPAAKLLDELI